MTSSGERLNALNLINFQKGELRSRLPWENHPNRLTFLKFVAMFYCAQGYQIDPGYLLCCRISRNESRLCKTCSRLSVAQRESLGERACLFRQPCKTGLTSCTGDGNNCKFNCCRGNTPCKRLTQVLICPRFKDYRVSKRQNQGLCF